MSDQAQSSERVPPTSAMLEAAAFSPRRPADVADNSYRKVAVVTVELRGFDRVLTLPANAVIHEVRRRWDVDHRYSWHEITYTCDLPSTPLGEQ